MLEYINEDDKMQIEIERLNEEELTKLYHDRIIYDFPEAEVKSLSLMKKLMKENNYIVLLFKINHLPVAYTILASLKNSSLVLLDYFAVYPSYRGHGVGGKILSCMKKELQEYDGVLLEVENPFLSDIETRFLKERRIAFYLRSGVIHTHFRTSTQNVPYQILFYPIQKKKLTEKETKEGMDAFYSYFFPEEIMEIRQSYEYKKEEI